jgi:hypothetical protein
MIVTWNLCVLLQTSVNVHVNMIQPKNDQDRFTAERMEELAGQASSRDTGTSAGIATDKLLALSSDPFPKQTTITSTYTSSQWSS